MRSPVALLVAAVSSASLIAQSMTLSAPAPASLFAQAGASQQTVPVPAGAMALQGNVTAAAGGSTSTPNWSDLTWSAVPTPHSVDFYLSTNAVVAITPGQASAGPLDLLLSVSSGNVVPMAFTLTRFVAGSPGVAMPYGRVDVDNDGSFELDETTPNPVEFVRMIGPTPLVIRFRIGVDASVLGTAASSLHLQGLPGSTSILPLQPGCGAPLYQLSPRLDGNLEFGINAVTANATVAVFGLATQPLLLGSLPGSFGGPLLPCVLMPSLDWLAVATMQPQVLVVPPAVRPIVLYTQGVDVLPFLHPSATFSTSPAYQVNCF